MSNQATPPNPPPPIEPQHYPASLDEFMRLAIDVANLSRAAKLARIRAFEAHLLRERFPGATESDISRRFYQRQKTGFENAAAWNEYSNAYAKWWAEHRAKMLRNLKNNH